MTYKKDLYLIPKSRASTIAGVFSIIFGVAFGVYNDFSIIWPVYSLFPIIMGLLAVAYGRGYNSERFFGKSFIEINETEFSLKTGAFKKSQSVKWNDVSSLKYEAAVYIFFYKDGSQHKIDLKSLEFELIQEIKEVVSTIAKSNNIQLITD